MHNESKIDQPETIESLTIKMRDLQEWKKRHDFKERLILYVGAAIGLGMAIWFWILMRNF
jgi:hypothetical protein